MPLALTSSSRGGREGWAAEVAGEVDEERHGKATWCTLRCGRGAALLQLPAPHPGGASTAGGPVTVAGRSRRIPCHAVRHSCR